MAGIGTSHQECTFQAPKHLSLWAQRAHGWDRDEPSKNALPETVSHGAKIKDTVIDYDI